MRASPKISVPLAGAYRTAAILSVSTYPILTSTMSRPELQAPPEIVRTQTLLGFSLADRIA